MDGGKYFAAQVNPEKQEKLCKFARKFKFAGHFGGRLRLLHNGAVKHLQHERHHQHNGGLALLDVLLDMQQPLADGNCGAAVDLAEESAGAFIGVMQRQHREECVFAVNVDHGAHAFEIGADISLG